MASLGNFGVVEDQVKWEKFDEGSESNKDVPEHADVTGIDSCFPT
jgi:hypothetical protein